MQRTAPLTRFRRFYGYDYARGAAMFLTFTLEPRRPLLGQVEGAAVSLSPAGEAVWAELRKESARRLGIVLRTAVVMPDHVHVRVQMLPNLPDPLKELGRFVYNVKCRSQRAARKAGIEISWQRNYHDRILCSAEIIETVDHYIANNPLKWTLMHGDSPPLRVREPLDSPLLPDEEWWTGVGAEELLAPGRRIAAVRLSRTIPPDRFAAVSARLREAADKGWVLAGTWISPCEQAVFADLSEQSFPLVRAVQDPLASVYRPKGGEPVLFAAGRYLLLSRIAAPGAARGAAWHGINEALADLARRSGGTAVYVRQETGEAEPRWDFAR